MIHIMQEISGKYVLWIQIRVICLMKSDIKEKIVNVCDAKIAAKGNEVGLSFYAFFSNKNDDPELLMQVAQWWIMKKN